MAKQKATHPSDYFKQACRNTRAEFDVVSISEVDGLYSLNFAEAFDLNKITRKNNITLQNCGQLSGDYIVEHVSGSVVKINATSGLSTENGELLCYPYYRPGNASFLINEQDNVNEFPFIHFIETDDISYPSLRDNEIAAYDGKFQFLIMDKRIISNSDVTDSEYEKIKNEILNDLLEIVNDFYDNLDLLVDNLSAKLINPYPTEGVGSNSSIKQGSTYNCAIAGYKLTLNALIQKEYELQQCI